MYPCIMEMSCGAASDCLRTVQRCVLSAALEDTRFHPVTSAEMPGLLLPQVAAKYDRDRETFLAQTCRKAGLPPTA